MNNKVRFGLAATYSLPGQLSTGDVSNSISKLSRLNHEAQSKFTNLSISIQDKSLRTQIENIANTYVEINSQLLCIHRSYENEKLASNQLLCNLHKEIEDLNNEVAQKDTLIAKLKTVSLRKSKLKTANAEAQALLEEAQVALENKEHDIALLKASVEKYKRKLFKTKNEARNLSLQQSMSCDSFSDEISSLTRKIDFLEREKNRIDSDNTELQQQLENLKSKLGEANETIKNLEKQNKSLRSRQSNIFAEQKFELTNPYEGEMKKKFDHFKNLIQFEAQQRAQLIINESSRELNILSSELKNSKESIDKLNKSIEITTNERDEAKRTLNDLIAQLKDVTDNESILGNNSASNSNSEVLLSSLSSNGNSTSSLINRIILANRRMVEQLKASVRSSKEKGLLLEEIEKITGVDPSSIPSTISRLKSERKGYKRACAQLDSQITELVEDVRKSKGELNKLSQKEKEMQSLIESMKKEKKQNEKSTEKMSKEINNMNTELYNSKNSLKQLKNELEAKNAQLIESEDENRKLRRELNERMEENIALDNDLKKSKERIRVEFERAQRSVDEAEEAASRKVMELQRQHRKDISAVQRSAEKIKSSSYEVVDATYAQIGELKRTLRDVVDKLEATRKENRTLREEKERLEERLRDTARRLKDAEDNFARNTEKIRLDAQRQLLERQTKDHAASADRAVAAVKERERICSMIVGELGPAYGVDRNDVGDDEGLVTFVRRVKEDLKKLRVFQQSAIRGGI